MREATRTLLRELIGVYSCRGRVLWLLLALSFLIFWLTKAILRTAKVIFQCVTNRGNGQNQAKRG